MNHEKFNDWKSLIEICKRLSEICEENNLENIIKNFIDKCDPGKYFELILPYSGETLCLYFSPKPINCDICYFYCCDSLKKFKTFEEKTKELNRFIRLSIDKDIAREILEEYE